MLVHPAIPPHEMLADLACDEQKRLTATKKAEAKKKTRILCAESTTRFNLAFNAYTQTVSRHECRQLAGNES